MPSTRLEAFSDGVLAIIITIMVLELHPPEGASWQDLVHTSGLSLLTYVVSFAYVGIYWVNHHHLFQLVEKIDGKVLWANLFLLFWLSLFPFTTAWMDDTRLARIPVLVYGVDLLLAAAAYALLEHVLMTRHGSDSVFHQTLNRDVKTIISPVLYGVGILAALCASSLPPRAGVIIALGCYVLVALMWIVPNPRVERSLR
ncbi:TMEM175 family protein [Propionibacterium sp.]|uniref:TMEM175 family protein n=1 Tax=Propionibacterium sp. TaxID=1977903 RepID=UPI0039EB1BCB